MAADDIAMADIDVDLVKLPYRDDPSEGPNEDNDLSKLDCLREEVTQI